MDAVASSPQLEAELKRRFSAYQCKNLADISVAEFEGVLNEKIGRIDSNVEGYGKHELQQQRDLSIKYHWGHNHDFGDFQLPGRMGDRHFELMADCCCPCHHRSGVYVSSHNNYLITSATHIIRGHTHGKRVSLFSPFSSPSRDASR